MSEICWHSGNSKSHAFHQNYFVGGQESDLNIFHKFSPDFLDFPEASEIIDELICRGAEETGALTREVPYGKEFQGHGGHAAAFTACPGTGQEHPGCPDERLGKLQTPGGRGGNLPEISCVSGELDIDVVDGDHLFHPGFAVR